MEDSRPEKKKKKKLEKDLVKPPVVQLTELGTRNEWKIMYDLLITLKNSLIYLLSHFNDIWEVNTQRQARELHSYINITLIINIYRNTTMTRGTYAWLKVKEKMASGTPNRMSRRLFLYHHWYTVIYTNQHCAFELELFIGIRHKWFIILSKWIDLPVTDADNHFIKHTEIPWIIVKLVIF